VVFLATPLDSSELVAALWAQVAREATGEPVGLPLYALCEWLRLEKRTCLIRVLSKNEEGMLAFVDGVLMNAVCGQKLGEEAARTIFSWEGVTIEFAEVIAKIKPLIQRALSDVLGKQDAEVRKLKVETGTLVEGGDALSDIANEEASLPAASDGAGPTPDPEPPLLNPSEMGEGTESPAPGPLAGAETTETGTESLSVDVSDGEADPPSPLESETVSVSVLAEGGLPATDDEAEDTEVVSPADLVAESSVAEIILGAVTESPTSIIHNGSANGHAPTLSEGEDSMAVQTTEAKIDKTLAEIMTIGGAMGVALVDITSGMALGKTGNTGLDLDVAAAGNSEVVKSKMKVMRDLGIRGEIEDILITLGTQYHLIRPLGSDSSLFLYVVLNKETANLALARRQLSKSEAGLVM